jgi:vacuole morphology and inheritance protein 14
MDDVAEGRVGEGLNVGTFKDLTRLTGAPLPLKDAPMAPAAAVHKTKTSLGKFGRLGGSARPKR